MAFIWLVLTIAPVVAVAQEGPAEKAVREEIKARQSGENGLYGSSTRPNNVSLSGMPLSQGGNNEQESPDFGANSVNAEKIVLQPLKGYRTLVDSGEMKEMLKELTAKKVPVLFQTYYMVENGAATGYLGGLNTVSNIISNTMQTQEMQWKLLQYADEASGNRFRMREAYTTELLKNFDKEKSWPAALYKTVGDGGKDNSTAPKDIPKNSEDEDIFSLRSICPRGAQLGGGGRCLLSELLFPDNGEELSPIQAGNPSSPGANSPPYKNQDLSALKDEFVRLIGDIEWKEEGNVKGAQALVQRFRAPEQKAVGGGQVPRRGFELRFREALAEIWQSLGRVLKQTCVFSTGQENLRLDMGKKRTLGNSKEIKRDDVWKASSIDTPLTEDLIEQLYAVGTKPQGGLIAQAYCDKLEQDMNESALNNLLSGNQNSGGDNPENCENGAPCRRNRVYLKTAVIIARSRTYQIYSKLYFDSMKFAVKLDHKIAVEQLFQKMFPHYSIEELIEMNRVDWRLLQEEIALEVERRRSGRGPNPVEQASSPGPQVDNGGSSK